ncbi:TetR/AcrR family transcriptional regulator [Gulosibacter sp. 10]|uniref:TetR/AcrR family transcriptional regulator n=1 Tax=Gulosibacter sp. 10 TaxID=1255570 RepID=UPI00097E99D2|nr:TetR family transcriptional regulator [Gulosibacter sp. 10]SJM49110.1 Transcriptional regulator, TetR family [Gulosibacter sp. 10]
MAHTTKKRRGTGREDLIRAAVRVVGRHGLEGATVRRIADEAKVHNTLITHYFGTRDELLAEATALAFDEQVEIVDFSVELALDPEVRKAFFAEFEASNERQLFLYEMVSAPHRRPQLQQTTASLYTAYIDRMQQSLARHGFPEDRSFARAVFAAVDGLILQRVAVATTEQILEACARLGDLLVGYREFYRAREAATDAPDPVR